MARKLSQSKSAKASRKHRRLRTQYEDYLKKYKARKNLLHERGLEMADPNYLSFRDYKSQRIEKINDLKIDIKEGKRRSIGDVNRELVSDQAYELSQRKAEVLLDYFAKNEPEILDELGIPYYRYYDEFGNERVNLKNKIEIMMKIRQGDFVKYEVGYWDAISSFRDKWFHSAKELKEELRKKWNVDTFEEALRKEVGQTFFDSPD